MLCHHGGLYDFPKVVDFGLVKDLDPGGDPALTRADLIAGTLDDRLTLTRRLDNPAGS